MPKSAQQKFNEYLEDCHKTSDAIGEFTNATNEYYNGYAFAAGYLGMQLADAIGYLPKAKRQEFRDRLQKKAQEIKNQILIETIKDTA
jgi:hypothetical protein